VGTAAAPVVSSGMGERVVAAGMTLLLAGGVTVGAAKIVKGGDQDEPRPRAVAAAPAPTPDPPRVRAKPAHVDHPAFDAGRTGDAGDVRAGPPIVDKPEPSPVVEPTPSVEPSPSPVADPSPEPTVTLPPPAPGWTMSFGSDLLGDTSFLSLVNSPVQGKVGKVVRYSQTVTGSLVGPKRELTRINLEYWGSVKGNAGNADLKLFLDAPAGSFEYRASASLESVNLAEDGSAVYSFTGSYALASAPVASAIMPHHGSIRLTLSFWSDGTTLYASSLELVEAS
jgi:hypothetical protein